MKTFLKILLILLIIALISAVVIGVYLFLLPDRPLLEGLIIIGVILGLWLAFVVIRKLIIRYRAKRQVERVIQQEQALAVGEDKRRTPQQLLRDLRKRWRKTIGVLRRSQLKFRGDPLYVLPWYMVIGRPTAGKSTALRNARLLLPEIDLPRQGPGSTINMDWWLYEQAIVIDTAGRYAVPEEVKRDRREWATLLEMLARHKQKEPINGLVVTVSADRLLEASEDDLLEEGRQVRASMNELMERLEVHAPVYLLVTKCDLVNGFSNWSQYLPEEARAQSMGFLLTEHTVDVDAVIDRALDAVLDRIKEIRLLMLERSQNPDDSLLRLPTEMERLRRGLHLFARTALKENPYQDTPRFRGMFFSSSQQALEDPATGERSTQERGLFLHEFFTRVLPADRRMLEAVPSAGRIRRAARNWALGIGGGATLAALLLLTALYGKDRAALGEIVDTFDRFELEQSDIDEQVNALNRLRELILALEQAEGSWLVPWTGRFGASAQRTRLIEMYNERFKGQVLGRLDGPLKERIVELQGRGTSDLAGGLIRRINLLETALAGGTLDDKPRVLRGYLRRIDSEFGGESADQFTDLYNAYLRWQSSPLGLQEEVAFLREGFLQLIERSRGDYGWMIDWANAQVRTPVTLGDFWGGSRSLEDAPVIEAAYTLDGREFILAFLAELQEANAGSAEFESILANFNAFYERRYFRAWADFADRFDEGWGRFRERREWLSAMEPYVDGDAPYFAFMQRMFEELRPFQNPEGLDYGVELEFFNDMVNFTAGEEGGGAGAGKAAKLGLKLIGKAGKAGKAVAGVGKKGLKIGKKVKKLQGKGKEELDNVLEDAAKTLADYRAALGDIAFNAESLNQSYAAISAVFADPNNPAAGDGPPAAAWNAVVALQKLAGRPLPSNQTFWNLYTGPVRLAQSYMEQETGCYLQEKWGDDVVGALEGVTRNKVGTTLIGEGGLVWQYIDTHAGPFLQRRSQRGYLPNSVNGRSVTWTPEFLDFVNKAAAGRFIVGNEFTVRIDALPTGVNLEAALSPYATFLQLHCADNVQSLANYNYATGTDFVWSLEKCGDVSLNIEVGHVTLRKQYNGIKGFPAFLADLRDGRRVFNADEFPGQKAQLANESVTQIDVNYVFRGQVSEVLQTLESVPLDPPREVAVCWQQ